MNELDQEIHEINGVLEKAGAHKFVGIRPQYEHYYVHTFASRHLAESGSGRRLSEGSGPYSRRSDALNAAYRMAFWTLAFETNNHPDLQ